MFPFSAPQLLPDNTSLRYFFTLRINAIRIIHHIPILMFLIILTFSGSVSADEQKENIESLFYKGFRTIDYFGWITVSLEGSAKNIGLDEEELTDFLKLRFKNSFAGLEYKKVDNILEAMLDDEHAKQIGTINLRVWTVGSDYPVAFYVGIKAGNLEDMEVYDLDYLGYGSKKNVPDTIRDSISLLTDNLAIIFFKARDEI